MRMSESLYTFKNDIQITPKFNCIAHTHTNLPPSKMFLARDEAVSGLYLPLIAYLDKCDTMAEIMSV